LFKKFRDCNNPPYRKAVKQAVNEIRKAKRAFEKKSAENIEADNKSFFAYAHNRNLVRPSIEPLVNETGEKLTTAADIYEELNSYFSSVSNSHTGTGRRE
jgi:hypothetical protein